MFFYRTWLYSWVTWQVSYKKQQLPAFREHLSSPPVLCCCFFVVSVLLIFSVFCVVLLCVLTLSVQCREVRYDFRIKTVFGSYLPLVVCRRVHVLFALVVFACVQWCPPHIMLCFCFVCSRLCCQFLCIVYIFIAPSTFSRVWLFFSVHIGKLSGKGVILSYCFMFKYFR